MEHVLFNAEVSGSIIHKKIKKCLGSILSVKALKGQSFAPSDFWPHAPL